MKTGTYIIRMLCLTALFVFTMACSDDGGSGDNLTADTGTEADASTSDAGDDATDDVGDTGGSDASDAGGDDTGDETDAATDTGTDTDTDAGSDISADGETVGGDTSDPDTGTPIDDRDPTNGAWSERFIAPGTSGAMDGRV
jgi:hypothetical protein